MKTFLILKVLCSTSKIEDPIKGIIYPLNDSIYDKTDPPFTSPNNETAVDDVTLNATDDETMDATDPLFTSPNNETANDDAMSDSPIKTYDEPDLLNITSLNYSHFNLFTIPDKITEYKNLINLYLSQNHLKTVPETITKLKKLETIDISNNNFESFPLILTRLPNIKILNISQNFIKSFDESFGNLKKLKTLYLSRNQLSGLPQSFTSLRNLVGINLLKNHIEELPSDFGKLNKLEWLNLSYNKLKYLPESFENLTNLQEISIQNNKLDSIPKNIGNLSGLASFDLSFNNISEIPPSFGNLISLKKLFLDENSINTIPSSFGGLINVKEMILSSNQLTCVPFSFKNLKMIKKLDLRKNMIRKRGIGDSLGITELKSIFKDRVLLDEGYADAPSNLDATESSIFKILKNKPLHWNFDILKTLKCEYSSPDETRMNKNEMFSILSDFCFNKYISIDCRNILQEFVEDLWATDENQNRWIMQSSMTEVFKNLLGCILNTLNERKKNGDIEWIEFCLGNIAWAVKYSCFEDQLQEIKIAYSILMESSNTLDKFIEFMVAVEKEKIFNLTICPGRFNNDLVEYWKNRMSHTLGFKSTHTKINIDDDPFNGNNASVLDAFFSKFTPEYITGVVLNRIKSSGVMLSDFVRTRNHNEFNTELSEFRESSERMILFSKCYCKYNVTYEMILEFLVQKKILVKYDESISLVGWFFDLFTDLFRNPLQ